MAGIWTKQEPKGLAAETPVVKPLEKVEEKQTVPPRKSDKTEKSTK